MFDESEPFDRKLHELATLVGANMGWDWRYSREDSNPHCAAIVGPEGMQICLTAGSYAMTDRVHISGRYPEGTTHSGRRETFSPRSDDKRASITCAVSKGVTQIARDILHRFLPAYQEQYQDGLQRRRQWLDAHERQQAVLDQLAAVMGPRCRKPADGRDQDDRLHLNCSRSVYGHLEVSYQGDTVSIEARYVPVEVAVQIAALLATC